MKVETETMLFEFYVHWIWPVHRLFVKRHYSKRCQRCGVAEEYSALDLAKICALCREYEKTPHHSQSSDEAARTEIENTLTAYENAGRGSYDAVVLFSGGKDSSYLLYRLLKTHPQLRLLALTVNNSFMSSLAMENAVAVAKKLNVAHITIAPPTRVFKNMFRFALKNFRGLGSAQTVDMLDGEFLIDQGRILAATMQIPLVIVGYSHEQVKIEHLEKDNWYSTGETRAQAAVYSIEELTEEKDRHYWWSGERFPKAHHPRIIFPYYGWDLSEEFIKGEVNRLGLIEKKKTSPVVTNNTLIPLQGLMDVIHLGYSSWEPEFTQMVREGKANKKYWQSTFELLQYSAHTGHFLSGAKRGLELLDLTPEEVGLEKALR